ncbi:MAG: hypothetical protein O6922_04170, partial [Chloroflexi bacterium]|nr:hypothetical protein [Chloroflexota bacterium]
MTERMKSVRQAVFLIALSAVLWSTAATAQGVPANCPQDLATADIIDHDFSVSFCELCGVGTVTLVVENPYRQQDDVDFSNIVITEDLRSSGLTYVSNSTRFTTKNVAPPAVVEPAVSGPNGSVLTWTLSDKFVLEGASGGNQNNRQTLTIEFDVSRSPSVGEEGLVLANRTIEGQVSFTPSCDTSYTHVSTSGPGVLPLHEPEPQIIKTARNVDAGQGAKDYSDPVYGHEHDDVIWRIEVRNDGAADLQDLQFSDMIQPGNFEI